MNIKVKQETNHITGRILYWVEVDGKRIDETFTSNIDEVNRHFILVKSGTKLTPTITTIAEETI